MSSQDLEKCMAALRREMRGAKAPEHVETALRSAFRRQAKVRARRNWARWAMALAAGLALLAGATVWLQGRTATPAVLIAKPAVTVPAVQPAAVVPAPHPVVRQVTAKRRRRMAARTSSAPQPPQEEATGFLALDDTLALAPIESAQVLRVRVPRSTLIRFGVAVNQDSMTEPIQADVVFAQDGIARAIRFVK